MVVTTLVVCSDITKHLRVIRNAWHFQFKSVLVFTVQWFRVGGKRCSLLNAALYLQSN